MSWLEVAVTLVRELGATVRAWLASERAEAEPSEPRADPVSVRHATESHISASREGRIAERQAAEKRSEK